MLGVLSWGAVLLRQLPATCLEGSSSSHGDQVQYDRLATYNILRFEYVLLADGNGMTWQE